ncbi:MAG: FKBP-type peptidyl-prolyl cis-trans isomerase [Bacteroidales bacterium]|nr:FKBP-type peptidyl-prolyl cis-trans isomerase [Tenuifilaceae bacterium]
MLRLLFIPVALVAIVFSGCKPNLSSVSVKTDADSMSYALGVDIANSIKRNDMQNIDVMVLAKGIEEAMNEKEGVMTQQDAIAFINTYMTKERERVGVENLEAGKKFLEENAKKEGVIVDSTGLQYKVVVEGEGARPIETDVVKVHYHGSRIDGTVFESTLEKDPVQFALNRVIRGWTIGLQKMTVGSKYIFYIPADLAYGANPRPGAIKPNDVLVFEIELFDIVKE